MVLRPARGVRPRDEKPIHLWTSISITYIPVSVFPLSQTTGYAIRALTCLADDPDEQLFIQDIADRAGVPRPYLAKILKRLNEAALIESKRGYKGGVWLARPPENIALWDIALALEGDGFLSRCMLGCDTCSDRRDCPAHEFWDPERDRIANELTRITLAEVTAFERANQA